MQDKKPREHAFYYWKTTTSFDTVSVAEIKKLGVSRFYLHYFDIDWNEYLQQPMPVGEGQEEYVLPIAALKYTPVVFITNRTFEHISPDWCDTLASKLSGKIAEKTARIKAYYKYGYRHEQFEAVHSPVADTSQLCQIDSEIQIDCDWTAATKYNYFHFLKAFKELNPGKTISATIRLYPYKYRNKMGVPPVDKGMLMCYNLGGITDASTKNSVFGLQQMTLYMDAEKYPLPLDIALPVFGWYVWFRDGKYKGIVHETEAVYGYVKTLQKSGNIYRVATDTVLDDNYYREGDELRAEFPDGQELLQAVALLTEKLPGCQRITFFDWSHLSTTKYEKEIQEIFKHY